VYSVDLSEDCMKLNTMEVLSRQEIEAIIVAARDVLENKGVQIGSLPVLELLAASGLPVDRDEKMVRFPQEIQDKLLSGVPTFLEVVDRDGKTAFTIGDGKPHFASGHNAVNCYSYKDDAIHPFTTQDVRAFAAISHHLDEIEMIGLPSSPSDVDPDYSLLVALKTVMETSTKPIFFSTDSKLINHIAMDMADTLYKRPKGAMKTYMISQLSPTSPLFWEESTVEALAECARRKFPVAILPEPITGLTAPYSLAGLLTLNTIEALSGIYIVQALQPGSSVLWASSWTAFDMKRSAALVGSLETSLCRIGGAQIAKALDLPAHTTAPNSDNHAHDEQNSWERTFSLICAAAAANDLIVNCGMYACGMTISLEQLVMDAELVGQVKRLMQGIQADDYYIAKEQIMHTDPRGTFVMDDHTLDLLYSDEHREPLIASRNNYHMWKESGSKDSLEYAHEIVEKLLQLKVPQLSPELVNKLDAIIKNS